MLIPLSFEKNLNASASSSAEISAAAFAIPESFLGDLLHHHLPHSQVQCSLSAELMSVSHVENFSLLSVVKWPGIRDFKII